MNTIQPSGVVSITHTGTPDVLRYHTVTLQQPGHGEVLMSQKAIGVNFVDIFFRNGTFPMPAYPAQLGLEAAGVIEQVAEGVTNFAVGDRVGYHSTLGSYAEKRVLPAIDLFKLPDDISFDQAAAVTVKGLTAYMLLKDSHEVKAGETVLIHAMTGGVGRVLSNWAKSIGATVIGTVGSAAKKELALSNGFEYVIDLQAEDFVAKVNEITKGKGIDVVYDGTGTATFSKSVSLVKKGGSAVLYGWPSGMPEIDEVELAQRKIRYVHPALRNYDHAKVAIAIPVVFDQLRKGVLGVQQPTVYALADAAKAHADLESRKTTGSIILRP